MNGLPFTVRRPWLLVSDIDDTLTGDDRALAHFAQVIRRNRRRLWFAVNSSRPAASVARTLSTVFPDGLAPDAVITALGTEISVAGKPLPDWEARFSGWPHRRVFAILRSLGHRPHDAQLQTHRKVSFAVPPGAPQRVARQTLEREGIPCRIIASGIDDFDVIPQVAGKDTATLVLAGALGCEVSRVIVAGDSGNDLAMFLAVPNRIAVANARPELIGALKGYSFYHAREPHAAGVLEGLVHFGALPAETLEI